MPSGPNDRDARVRLAVFNWLEETTAIHGEVLPWSILIRGFDFEGQKVPLVSMQGIFKPRVLPHLPLSIRTSHEGPYDDHFGYDNLLRHGLQVLHNQRIWTPRSSHLKPDRELLEQRYERFRRAS